MLRIGRAAIACPQQIGSMTHLNQPCSLRILPVIPILIDIQEPGYDYNLHGNCNRTILALKGFADNS